MQGVVAVSSVPIAVAFVVGVAGFIALLPLLMADQSRTRTPVAMHETRVVDEVPAQEARSPGVSPVPVAVPARVSRLRLVASLGALLVWSVWSVRRPHDRGRHD